MLNFTGISNWSTLKKGITTTRPSHRVTVPKSRCTALKVDPVRAQQRREQKEEEEEGGTGAAGRSRKRREGGGGAGREGREGGAGGRELVLRPIRAVGIRTTKHPGPIAFWTSPRLGHIHPSNIRVAMGRAPEFPESYRES